MKGAMIRVQLFASLKDAAGESSVELPLPSDVTLQDVYSALVAKFPRLEQYRPFVLTAVNEEYAAWDTRVGPDDAVAFFPPVSGGTS